MNAQLIILNPKQSIIVSDEKMNSGDLCFDTYSQTVKQSRFGINDQNAEKYFKKIIAGVEGYPSINYSALSDKDAKRIGYVDVKKLTEQAFPSIVLSTGTLHRTLTIDNNRNGFIKGFEACQQLNDKKFTEDDVRKAIFMAREQVVYVEGYSIPAIINYLSQKIFNIEMIMEIVPDDNNYGSGEIFSGNKKEEAKILKIL